MNRLSPEKITESVDLFKQMICSLKAEHGSLPAPMAFLNDAVDIIEQLLRDKSESWSQYEPNQYDADRLCREILRVRERLSTGELSELGTMAYETKLNWLVSEANSKYLVFIPSFQ